MKQLVRSLFRFHRSELIASFGHARLVRDRRGRVVLNGGSLGELQEALEWMSFFLPEAVLYQAKAA